MSFVIVYCVQDIVDNAHVVHSCILVQALYVLTNVMQAMSLLRLCTSNVLHVSPKNAMPHLLGEIFVSYIREIAFPAGRLHDPIDQKPPVLSQSSKVRGAISALVGTPQAVYMYTQNQVKLLKYKGVYQTFEGQFLVRAPIGRDGAPRRLGQYSNMLAAARAYDEVMLQHYGTVAKHKLNFPAEHIRSVVP